MAFTKTKLESGAYIYSVPGIGLLRADRSSKGWKIYAQVGDDWMLTVMVAKSLRIFETVLSKGSL